MWQRAHWRCYIEYKRQWARWTAGKRLCEQTHCLNWLVPRSYQKESSLFGCIYSGHPRKPTNRIPIRYTALPQSWFVSRRYVTFWGCTTGSVRHRDQRWGHRRSGPSLPRVGTGPIIMANNRIVDEGRHPYIFFPDFLFILTLLSRCVRSGVHFYDKVTRNDVTILRFLGTWIIPQAGDWRRCAVWQAVLLRLTLRVWNECLYSCIPVSIVKAMTQSFLLPEH